MNIRPLTVADRAVYLELVHAFYHSDAVLHPVPDCYFERTFDELMRSDAYAECYLFETEAGVAGYALLAKTFSQEAGGMVLWIEELYVKESCRSMGIGSAFFAFLEERYPQICRIRLEVEEENIRARELYRRRGFTSLPYLQMIKE